MASITELEQELALADRRLTEIHAQIGRQRALVHWLERAGDDATEAESLLLAVQSILVSMHSHRELILRELSKAPGERVSEPFLNVTLRPKGRGYVRVCWKLPSCRE